MRTWLAACTSAGEKCHGRRHFASLYDDIIARSAERSTGERFTVKRYRSEKSANEDDWRHLTIALEPLNPDYEPIELTAEDESPVAVIAELLEVVGMGTAG